MRSLFTGLNWYRTVIRFLFENSTNTDSTLWHLLLRCWTCGRCTEALPSHQSAPPPTWNWPLRKLSLGHSKISTRILPHCLCSDEFRTPSYLGSTWPYLQHSSDQIQNTTSPDGIMNEHQILSVANKRDPEKYQLS